MREDAGVAAVSRSALAKRATVQPACPSSTAQLRLSVPTAVLRGAACAGDSGRRGVRSTMIASRHL